MASTYTADEVLALLEQRDECEEECLMDLDEESDGDYPPEGDFAGSDGCQALVDPFLLESGSAQIVSILESCPEPAQRDSVLLLDPDLCTGMSLELAKYLLPLTCCLNLLQVKVLNHPLVKAHPVIVYRSHLFKQVHNLPKLFSYLQVDVEEEGVERGGDQEGGEQEGGELEGGEQEGEDKHRKEVDKIQQERGEVEQGQEVALEEM